MARKEVKKPISVRLKPSVLEDLEALRTEKGCTTTEIIEKLLEAAIDFVKSTK